ncbi:MAG TPA: AAA family ATPase, partial [Polyangiaceae bacterium]
MPLPGVFPPGGPAPTSSRAEQAFHRALTSGLPPGWFAWHSLRVRTAENYEGEGDFVLAIPDRGILIVEVKGGSIEKRNGRWLQNGREMEKAPRLQAHEYQQKLLHKLRERCAGYAPWIAIATSFPDTPFESPPTQGDLEGAVLGQQDLSFLREALVELAARLFTRAIPPRSANWVSALHELWCETWTPVLSLGRRARLRERELIPLDRDQLKLLDYIEETKRFLVSGGPGTGKTLVAREMYRRFTAQSKRPLFLCSTNALAAGLRADGLADAWTVGELAASMLDGAQIPMQGGAPSSEWTGETWRLASLQAAVDAVPAQGSPYDAVIVDEAQDFAPGDWDLVKAIAADRPICAFGDDGQGFWDDRPLPVDFFPALFRLTSRYRCPEPLARFADQYRPRGHGAPEPEAGPIAELRIVRVPSARVLDERVANEIQKA